MKIIFLDRDGVINKAAMEGYIENWEDFEFLPSALEALRILAENDYRIFVVSNQSGVAKGLYTLEDLENITRRMNKIVQQHGGKIEDVVYCPHRDEDDCDCRKPKPGMLYKLEEKYNLDIDKGNTFYIGDSKSDIEAGKRFGLKTILLLCGKTNKEEKLQQWEYEPDYIREDLLDAVKNVLRPTSKVLGQKTGLRIKDKD